MPPAVPLMHMAAMATVAVMTVFAMAMPALGLGARDSECYRGGTCDSQ